MILRSLIKCSELSNAIKDDLTKVGDNVISVRDNIAKLQSDQACNLAPDSLLPNVGRANEI